MTTTIEQRLALYHTQYWSREIHHLWPHRKDPTTRLEIYMCIGHIRHWRTHLPSTPTQEHHA